jgi:hypothetical protein
MRLRRIALWSTGGVLLLLAIGFIWLLYVDVGFLKPHVERWVATTTGREFTIDGRFEVNLGRETKIVAEAIRLENADWSETPAMLEIEYLGLTIDTLSLLRAPLTISQIDLRNATIHLTRRDDGTKNWDFGNSAITADKEPEARNDGISFVVDRTDISNVQLVFDSPERTGPLDLRIDTLTQRHRADDFLELTFEAELGQRNFDVRAVVGTFDALLSNQNIEYEIEGRLDTLSFSSSGTIDDLAVPARPSVIFSARGPDINDLRRLLKLEEDGSGDINVTGSLEPSENGPLIVGLVGRLGQSRIDASASLTSLQNPDRFDAVVQASGPDLGRVLSLFGLQRIRKVPFTIDVDAHRDGTMFAVKTAHLEFADARFDLQAKLPAFPHLKTGTANLQITGSDFANLRDLFQLPGKADGPYTLDLKLDVDPNGKESIQIAVDSTLANIEAEGRVSHEPNHVGSEFDFTVRSENLGEVGKAFGLENLPNVPATAKASITLEDGALRLQQPLTIDIDGTMARFDGLISLAPGGEGSQLSFSANGPDLAHLVGMFTPGKQVPPLPFRLTGESSFGKDGIRFPTVRGTLGQSTVDIEGVLKPTALLAGSEFKVATSGPAFEELIAHFPALEVRPGAYRLSGQLRFDPAAISFQGVELSRARGNIRVDIVMGLPMEARIIDFDVSGRGRNLRSIQTKFGVLEIDEAPFSLLVRGNLRDRQLKLTKLDVQVGEAVANAQGILDFHQGGGSTEFEFDLKIPNLARLGLLNERRLGEQSLQVHARVQGDKNEVWIEELAARLGNSDIRGSVRLRKAEIPELSLEMQADLIHLAPLLESAAPVDDNVPVFNDGRLIPNVKVPFDAMKRFNASVALDIGELQKEAISLHDLAVRAEIQDGSLYVHEVRFEDTSGWLLARATLEPVGGSGKAMLAIKASELGWGFLGLPVDSSTKTEINSHLVLEGPDLRTMAGNANGVLFFDARNFVIPENRLFKRIYGDMLDEILSTINPFSKSDSITDVECFIVPIEIKDGQLSFAPNAFVRTDKIAIVSAGAIDLKSEKIEFTFNTTPRRGLTISAGEILNPYVMIVGTLGKPRLALDTAGGLISGGTAVATGGLSILAKAAWGRLSRSKDPCETASQAGTSSLQDRFADLPAVEPSAEQGNTP